ncbi:hypothetical protein RRSWK_02080 [Rhodopirellula sp. SWK7]|nr:hypothetical protein RRSWK_02080 [Rhodopirellula sp. SWK7]
MRASFPNGCEFQNSFADMRELRDGPQRISEQQSLHRLLPRSMPA